MRIPGNYRYVGLYDVNKIIERLSTETRWDMHTWRQTRFQVHRFTHTLPLLWLPNQWSPGEPLVVNRYPDFTNDYNVEPIYQQLYQVYPECTVVKSALIKLKAGECIGEHSDMSPDITLPHRIHICIVPGECTTFVVGGEPLIFKQGECWEINNLSPHSVKNPGLVDRVHLMIDLMPNALVSSITYPVTL